MESDLFSPEDTAALLAIRAVIAHRNVSPAELRALFGSAGLGTVPSAVSPDLGVSRSILRPAQR